MVNYDDFRVHTINLLTRNKYVCLVPNQEFDNDTLRKIDAQFDKHYMDKTYNFFAKLGASAADLGVLEIFKEQLFGVTTSRTASQDALSQIGEHCERLDLVGMRIGKLEGQLVAFVNGDIQSESTLSTIGQDLEKISESFLSFLRKHKLKLGGLKIGKGVGTNLGGLILFFFSDSGKLEKIRPQVQSLKIGTTTTQQLGKLAKSFIVNPWIFGEKGSFVPTKVIIRLFDNKIEGHERMGSKRYWSFAFDDLLLPR